MDRLFEFIFFFYAACIGYILIKRIMGVIPALVGTFIWISAAGNVLQGGNVSEEHSLLFSFIAVFYYMKSLEQPDRILYSLLIGGSLGVNILLRLNNIGLLVAVVAGYFIMPVVSRNWRLFIQRATLIMLGVFAVLMIGKINIWKNYGAVLAHIWNSPGAELEHPDPLASYIRENTVPRDEVFVWVFAP